MAAVIIPSDQLTIPDHLRARLDRPGLRLVPGPARPETGVGPRALVSAARHADRDAARHDDRRLALAARPAHRRLLVEVWAMRLALVAVAVFVGLAALQVVSGAAAQGASVQVTAGQDAILASGTTAAAAASDAVHVVRPGDTLWSIAAAVAPGSDPRPVVDELARRAGGATLQPGQRIPLAGLAG
jgi:hypothetical protein